MSIDHGLSHACCGGPPAELVRARELFTLGDYFACHEVLEEVWRATEGPLRDLYRGLIQIVVGLYHAQRGNLVGARQVLARGIRRVEQYPDECLGIDLKTLYRGASQYLAWLEAGALPPDPPPPVWRWCFGTCGESEAWTRGV